MDEEDEKRSGSGVDMARRLGRKHSRGDYQGPEAPPEDVRDWLREHRTISTRMNPREAQRRSKRRSRKS